MRRIVHLTASTFFGGPERQMLGLAHHLRNDFNTVIASFSEGGRCRPFLEIAKKAGHEAVELLHDTPQFRAAIRDVQSLIGDAEILFVHGYKAGLLGRIAARRVGIPVVGVSRGWTGENWKVKIYERLDRWNLKRLDHVVCVSNGQAEKVRRVGVHADKMSVIHNSARIGDFSPVPKSDRSTFTVLAAGRLSPEKGFQLLPAVAEQLAHRQVDIRFLMAGDGDLRESIQNDAKNRNVQDRIEFLGFRTDIDRLMADSDVLLLPSFTEGLPNVVLEAAAAGKPTVATRVGGTPEAILHGKTGFLVPAGDVNAMVDSLGQLANCRELCDTMGRSARLFMEQHFSFHSQADAYRELIERLVHPREVAELQVCSQ